MSFDQNMIIDATTGSIARFVNHSCSPNCRMIKWIVSGQPRMALFAGDRDIMTGEELTYDYNFDPFSAKNVQKCLCGSPNCRGVLGPKTREVKPPKDKKDRKAELKKTVKKGVAASKRKLGQMLGDKEGAGGSATKKRKIKTPMKKAVSKKVVKSTISSATPKGKGNATKAAKSATKVVKRSVVTKAVMGSKHTNGRVTKVQKSVKTYGKGKVQTKLAAAKTAGSGKSSLTIIAASSETKSQKLSPSIARNMKTLSPHKVGRPRKHSISSPSPRKAIDIPRSTTKPDGI
jgi:[histone H3]-lysine4 N-trimethyltransferase ASH1L